MVGRLLPGLWRRERFFRLGWRQGTRSEWSGRRHRIARRNGDRGTVLHYSALCLLEPLQFLAFGVMTLGDFVAWGSRRAETVQRLLVLQPGRLFGLMLLEGLQAC